jgi:hypothetical protein
MPNLNFAELMLLQESRGATVAISFSKGCENIIVFNSEFAAPRHRDRQKLLHVRIGQF